MTERSPRNACVRLVLRRDLVASDLFDPLLGTVGTNVSIIVAAHGESRATYTSPKATMQTVCQTPKPILGVTPLYKPLRPFLE